MPPEPRVECTTVIRKANHKCALIVGGSVMRWNNDDSEQVSGRHTSGDCTQFSSGASHICALCGEGEVNCDAYAEQQQSSQDILCAECPALTPDSYLDHSLKLDNLAPIQDNRSEKVSCANSAPSGYNNGRNEWHIRCRASIY